MSARPLSSESEIKTKAYLLSIRLFFISSKLFEAQITDVFDRLWPTLTALKMLRWQVRGFHEEYDVKDNERLSMRFVDQEDITWRPNLYRVCMLQTWKQMEESIAKDLLINLIARFEGWCENILREIGYSTKKDIKNVSKKMQFPGEFSTLITSLISGADPCIQNAFYNKYSHSTRSQPSHLDENLRYYRFFKECRNSIIHNAERTTSEIIDCKKDIASIKKTDLFVEELPESPCNTLNNPLAISLRGVVGFSQILLNIVSTMDCEFIKAKAAKDYLIKQLKLYNPGKPSFVNTKKINSTIRSICKRSHFKSPENPSCLYTLFKQEHLMK